ncbi:MAG: hypothetical protein AAF205_08870 [Pseudomonadota bacterium]
MTRIIATMTLIWFATFVLFALLTAGYPSVLPRYADFIGHIIGVGLAFGYAIWADRSKMNAVGTERADPSAETIHNRG